MKVAVIGATGMLGAMVAAVMSRDGTFRLTCTARGEAARDAAKWLVRAASWVALDAETATVEELAQLLEGHDAAVNAVGVIKPYIDDQDAGQVLRAIRVNAIFPRALATAAERVGVRVLQIATDCVYSGQKGAYVETDPHDALDVYGKTKSLGEVTSGAVSHLRCSIIGPEPRAHVSLLDWFLGQPHGASVNGFVNHRWNGVTTYHFGRLCAGVLKAGIPLATVQHVTAGDSLSKHQMLQCFATAYGRSDVSIVPRETPVAIDRTLSSVRPEVNAACWSAAGYTMPPAIDDMVRELAAFSRGFWPPRP